MSFNKKAKKLAEKKLKTNKRFKKIITIFLLIALVISAAGCCWYFLVFEKNKDSANIVEVEETEVEEVSDLIINGDFEKARKLAEDELSKNNNIENIRQLVNVEEADGNSARIIELYKPYIDNYSDKLDSEDYGKIAVAYEQSGDKVQAALYYRKSADLMDSKYLQADKEYLYNYADILEGKNTDAI